MSNKILNTYAAYAFDDLIRKQSSSGAIFSLIAEKILSLSGIVYGVTMTDDCKGAEFVRVDNIEQLHLLRGSKYIQAKWINNAMVRYSCIIFVTLFIFDVFIDNVFLRLSVCVAFFIFVQNLKVKKVTDAQSHFLRRMSTVVFYAHMIIFFLWGLIDGKEPSYGFTGFIASLVGTVVLAVIISANRIKNSRLVRELFG